MEADKILWDARFAEVFCLQCAISVGLSPRLLTMGHGVDRRVEGVLRRGLYVPNKFCNVKVSPDSGRVVAHLSIRLV